jgi:uncharacterized membrane protein YgcG
VGTPRATLRFAMRLRLLRRWLLLGAVSALGCYSPTLPLPPPLKPDITLTDAGVYRLRGGVVPNAQVFTLNTRTELIDGQQTGDSGLYDFELRSAEAGDVLDIWYQAGTDLSGSTPFALPMLAPSGMGGAGGTTAVGGSGGSGGSASGGGGAAGSGG